VYGIYGKENAQLLSMELPSVLARVVDTDTDSDNRTCAMNCLNNIAAYLPSLVIAGNEAVACALRVIEEQGTGAVRMAIPPAFLPLRQFPIIALLYFNKLHYLTSDFQI
jgi:hypothetical protein